MAVFFLYSAGGEIIEVRLDGDRIVFRTAWGRTPRIAYSRIMSVAHKKKILSIIRVRPPAQVVSIHKKGLLNLFSLSSPVSFTLFEEELPRFLAALRERVLLATGEDIDKGPATAQAQAASKKHPAGKPRIVSYVCLLLFCLMAYSIEINNQYERYLHEQRLYAQGLRAAAVVDAVHREETTSLFLPDPGDEFTFEYSYRLPDGGRRSGTAHLPREWLGRFGVGDSVEVVYLPDWPSDSRLADGEASADFLIVLVVLVSLLFAVLVFVCWAESTGRIGAAEPERRRRRSKRWTEIVRSLVLAGVLVWLFETPVGEFVELMRLARDGEVVSGRIMAREDGGGRGSDFVFSYVAGGREWVGKRGYPYPIGSRYQPGDGVRLYVLPDDARVVQFADAVERNLWLRYGPTLLFFVVTESALLVNLALLLLLPSRRVSPEHPAHPQA